MKKIILSLLSIVAAFTVFGQTDYYTGQTRVTGKNTTYLCEDSKISFVLTSLNKVFIGQTRKMRDGTPMDGEGPAMDYRGINDPDRTLLRRTFRETFSPEQIATMKEQEGGVTVYFYADPAGIIKDIVFIVRKTPATASVSPDQWFTLEQKLKQYITAKQEICKNYQYTDFFVVFKFDEL